MIAFDFNAEQEAKNWAQCWCPRWQILPAVLAECTVHNQLHLATLGEPGAWITVKKSAAPLFSGPEPQQLHITGLVWSHAAELESLLQQAIQVARDHAATRLLFGADWRHIFPGAPLENRALIEALESAGFAATYDVFDVEGDLHTFAPPAQALPDRVEIRPCQPTDVANLQEFFNREFPGRWRFDVLYQVTLAENDPSIVTALFVDGVCEGFALTQRQGCKLPIAGGVWGASLGAGWAALGPIGVSQRVRGQGLGGALLSRALEILRDAGAHRTIIDWTTLDQFYGKFGFEIARRYRGFELNF